MIGLVVAAFSIIQINQSLPDAQSIRDIELKVPLRVYSSDNLLISEFGDERRKPISIDETPQILIDAIIAGEDDNFYSHHGIDFFGLIRAALANYRAGSTQQGASTLTMQVARNFYLTPEKTYTRKIREVLLSIKLEQILSKDEILSLYINKMFLGHRAYGFGAAADVYYGKQLSELSIAETAVLAGLLKAPSSNNPLRNPTRAIQRRNYILGRLFELNKISEEQYETALAQPTTAKRHSRGVELSAPHIAEMVRASLIEELGENAYWQGLNVYTTIESDKQQVAQEALRAGLKSYDRRHGFRGPIKKVNLANIAKNAENQEEISLAYSDILSEIPNSQEQIPALVIASSSERSELYTNSYGSVELLIDNASWARAHRTANLRGEPPTSMATLLSPGDIVYIEPTADSEQTIKQQLATENIDVAELAKQIEWRLSQIPDISGALISMDPANGRIISLVGGYDFFLNKYNRAVQSIRQPGSNIKPFIYSASLDRGYTPASLISGAPIVLKDPSNGTVWRPENYSGEFFGPTRMRTALAKSMNLVSIRLLRSIGIPFAREYAERFGLNMNRFSPTLTMALGSGGVTPLELINAYGTIANGGYKVKPYFIDYITDKNGNVVYQAKQPEYCDECYLGYLEKYVFTEEDENEKASITNGDDLVAKDEEEIVEDSTEGEVDEQETNYVAPRVMSRANNFLTVSMLKDVVQSGTARKALALNRQDLAGKTGTTNDYVDAWFSGFNSKVVTTVWVGFDEPKSMGRGEAGSVAALPIWVDYMQIGLKDVAEDEVAIPEFIEEGFVKRNTGQRTDELDPDAVPEYFVVEALNPDVLATPLSDIDDPFNKSYEGDLENLDDFIPEQPVIAPEERIIDSREDTEGLF
ncbi:MAG: penicillin-binding protein 1A [Acidiferrobacterales bacterium]|nr:penicillin-binding protein 1A [Acidiferrobacterales bacterium]